MMTKRHRDIGPITASVHVAAVGEAEHLRRGRDQPGLGLVPKQKTTGGRPTLLGISKRGNIYLRYADSRGACRRLAARTATNGAWFLAEMLTRPPLSKCRHPRARCQAGAHRCLRRARLRSTISGGSTHADHRYLAADSSDVPTFSRRPVSLAKPKSRGCWHLASGCVEEREGTFPLARRGS
ncbi:MAG: transposase [Rhodospirillales bacterium]|nr:transposase [Rhodospirillales bacterium]